MLFRRKETRMKRRRGMTLIETLGVMVILFILMGVAGASVSGGMKRANRETVVNELQVYATSLADAYYDLGSPSFDPATTEGMDGFLRFLRIIQSDYLGVTFDFNTVVANDTGFEVTLAAPLDVYETPYKFWFVTKENVLKYAMVASGGDDGLIAEDGYLSQDYSDDIVLIVRPKL